MRIGAQRRAGATAPARPQRKVASVSTDGRADSNPDDDASLVQRFRDHPLRRFLEPRDGYVLTRFVFLRLLGFIYFVAFLSLVRQLLPLLGRDGLLPAAQFLDRVLVASGTRASAFARLPTLFWLGASDGALVAGAWLGLALSAAVTLGVTNAVAQFALWALYLSFVHIGQIFYGYGWEIQLCETGFLAVFLCPVRTLGPFPRAAPPEAPIWLLRWLAFRIMIGAGLIKLRGDPCWRDLTCLVYHYETQPIPNPLSYLLHQLPRWAHAGGVLFNHLVELVVPWFAFGPRRARRVAGLLLVAFQVTLILSGNLSFLNWLTIVPAIACFDDAALARFFPRRVRDRAVEIAKEPPSRLHRGVTYALAILVLFLSLGPVSNMLSPRQAMNASFDQLALVNTYGAFGSVGQHRHEVIVEGTADETPDERARWIPYEFPCKPGDVERRPCVVAPYQPRLDWQIWFEAMTRGRHQAWFIHLVDKLLRGDRGVMTLLANDPFPTAPPRFVRAVLYRYEFTRPGDGSGAWWRRTRVGEHLRPLSRSDPALLDFLEEQGWLRE